MRNKPIFINNHVTTFYARLLAVGRQAVKANKLHSCWIGSTGCLVKIKEDAKPKTVYSMTEMARLLNGVTTTMLSVNKRLKPDHTSPCATTSKRFQKGSAK